MVNMHGTATSFRGDDPHHHWEGPVAAKPAGYIDYTKAAPRKYVEAKIIVDWVILDEITEIVKYEAMSIVDKLLGVNSP